MKTTFTDYKRGTTVATDLVNTAGEVRRIGGEALADPNALLDFLTEHDLRLDSLTAGQVPTDDDLAEVRTLRDRLRAILEATTSEDVVERTTQLLTDSCVVPTLLRAEDGQWQWGVSTTPPASIHNELVAVTGAGLLGTLRVLSHDRFRHCAASDCDGVFVDTSKAGRRRYCTPEVCGNRLNVARHRARQRENGTHG